MDHNVKHRMKKQAYCCGAHVLSQPGRGTTINTLIRNWVSDIKMKDGR